MAHIPVMIDFKGRKVLIVGGGHVALRKLKVLLKTGAKLVVVAQKPLVQLKKMQLAHGFKLKLRFFRMQDLKDCHLVVIATDDKSLNQKIAARCEELGLLYNSATDAGARLMMSSFFRRGDLVVSVSTSGVAPRVAKMIVKALSKIFDRSWQRDIAALK